MVNLKFDVFEHNYLAATNLESRSKIIESRGVSEFPESRTLWSDERMRLSRATYCKPSATVRSESGIQTWAVARIRMYFLSLILLLIYPQFERENPEMQSKRSAPLRRKVLLIA